MISPKDDFSLEKLTNPEKESRNKDIDSTDFQASIKSFAEILYEKTGVINQNFTAPNRKYQLVMSYDKNKMSKQDQRQLAQMFKNARFDIERDRPELSDQFRFHLVPKNLEHSSGKIFDLIIRDLDKYEKYFEYVVDNEDQKRQFELEESNTEFGKPDSQGNYGHTYVYKFGESLNISANSIIPFMEKVINKEWPENFDSQIPPKKMSFSRKITAKNFEKKIITSKKDQMMWIYSRFCHGCEKFGPLYEKIARDYSVDGINDRLKFNRFDNDENSLEKYVNFDSTPIFCYYKKNYDNPYVYSSTKMNERLLNDWIASTSAMVVMKNINFLKGTQAALDAWKQSYNFADLKNVDPSVFE